MDLLKKFQKHWQQQFPNLLPGNCQLLVAASGGVDSVVLIDLVEKSGFAFVIAHCNFRLRGEESSRDENFVRSLGERYGKEVLVKAFDTKEYASINKCSIQEAARELRYAWFSEIIAGWKMRNDSTENTGRMQASSASNILTAHHADDTIETMLMHFFRGTGIQGLTGIQPEQKDRALLRPLLPFRKQELLAYAQVHGLVFAEDSSNASDKYTRNFFRNSLLPQIREIYPRVDENLLQNMHRFSEAAILYRQAVELQVKKLVEQKGSEWHIPVMKWKRADPLHTITWELIKPYGFTAAQADEVIKLLDADNGSYIASPTHRIIHNRNWMIISSNTTALAQHIVIGEGDDHIIFENGSLQIKTISSRQAVINHATATAFLNLDEIRYPLLLRKWKQGDYFYPLGMQKKKKVSRFLIDQKLSRTDKEKVWVLETDKKIIWVIGYRIDNRFRITEHTTRVLQLAYLT